MDHMRDTLVHMHGFLKICEVCNFGAITGSLCERTDCWFRLIWNCSFCKDEGVATFISS